MDNKLLEGLNRQVNLELYSGYLYLAMSAYFSEIAMDGFAKTVMKQAKEEISHAKRIYNYLLSRDEKIKLYEIDSPVNSFESPLIAIKEALSHEKVVSESIKELYELSKEVKDWASEIFLQWFVEEQVEEEDKFRTLAQKMENIEGYDCDINRMDRQFEGQSDV